MARRAATKKVNYAELSSESDSDVDIESKSSSSESSESELDDGYQVKPTRKRRQPPTKTKRKGTNKRIKKITGNDLDDLEKKLPANALFEALANPDADTSEIATDWLEKYEEDATLALLELMNMVLRSCGAVCYFEPHDMLDTELAAITVEEISLRFSLQTQHRFPFKAVAAFRQNERLFFQLVISQAHENGMIYDYEDGEAHQLPLMKLLIAWLGLLSLTVIRLLRYTLTLLLLAMIEELATIHHQIERMIKKVSGQIERATSRRKSLLEKLALTYQLQLDTINLYFDDITAITIGNRYRDVELTVRIECIKQLAQLVTSIPLVFYNANYLKYFGWLISDPTSAVRTEVAKCLAKVYRFANKTQFSLGIRQFTDRFYQQFLQMVQVDPSATVRVQVVAILAELLQLGYMEFEDAQKVIDATVPGPELANFILIYVEQTAKDGIEKLLLTLEDGSCEQVTWDDKETGKLDLHRVVELKRLCHALASVKKAPELFEFIGTRDNDWQSIVEYLLYDTLAIVVDGVQNPQVLLQALELDHSEKQILTDMVYGQFAHLLHDLKQKTKNKLSEITLTQLAGVLKDFTTFAIRNGLVASFLRLWVLVLGSDSERNIFSTMTALDQMSTYVDISVGLIRYFIEAPNIDGYREYFRLLLAPTGAAMCPSAVRDAVEECARQIVDQIPLELEDNTNVSAKLLGVSPHLRKLEILSEAINLREFDPKLPYTLNRELFEAMDKKMLGRLTPDLVDAVSDALDLELSLVLSKVEVLSQVDTAHQSRYDLEREFRGFRKFYMNLVQIMNSSLDLVVEAEIHQGLSQAPVVTSNIPEYVDLLYTIATLVAIKILELSVVIRGFYNVHSPNNTFDGFSSVFADDAPLGQLAIHGLSSGCIDNVTQIFLYKEAYLANLLQVKLKRLLEERAPFEEAFGSNLSDESDVWAAEQSLCVFVLKLYGYIDAFAASEVSQRIALNSASLGAVYALIVEKHESLAQASNQANSAS